VQLGAGLKIAVFSAERVGSNRVGAASVADVTQAKRKVWLYFPRITRTTGFDCLIDPGCPKAGVSLKKP
jgi:hypothetical protein